MKESRPRSGFDLEWVFRYHNLFQFQIFEPLRNVFSGGALSDIVCEGLTLMHKVPMGHFSINSLPEGVEGPQRWKGEHNLSSRLQV